MTAEDLPDLARAGRGWPTLFRFGRTVALGSTGAAIFAVAGLLGYIPGFRVLGSIRPDYIPMAPSAAGCLLVLSVALFFHARRPWHGASRLAMLALVLLVVAFSLLVVAGSVTGLDLTFEARLTRGLGTLGAIPIGRMSPASGVVFTMAGLGTFLLLGWWNSRHAQRIGHGASSLGVLSMLGGATVLLAYMHRAPFMYRGTIVPMAATSAIALLCLGTALAAAAGPKSFPVCQVAGDQTSARLSRAFLPLTVGVFLLASHLAPFYSLWFDIPSALLRLLLATAVVMITLTVVAQVAQLIGKSLDQVNRKLRESEARSRAITESANDAIVTADRAGNIVGWNPGAEAMFGYSESEVHGKPFALLVRGQYEDRIADAMSRITSGEAPGAVDKTASLTGLRKGGIPFPLEISVATWKGTGDRYFTGIIRDTTERTQAALALGEALSEARRLRDALDQVPSYIFMKDRQFRYLYANQPTLNLFHCSAEQLVGCDDSRFFPPAMVTRLREIDARVLQGEQATEEIDETGADGERHIYLEVKSPIRAEPDSTTIMGLLGISTDITARKLAEEQVRRMALMVDAAPNSITVHGFDGHFLYANRRTFELHGYTQDEFMALDLAQLDVPADAMLIATRMQELREHGEASFDAAHFRKDGSILPLQVSVKLTTWGGKDAILSVATDITASQRAEEERAALQEQLTQAQKMESIGLLAGGVAHDFNNMLAAILGYAELTILKLGPGHAVHSYIEAIRTAAQRSSDLTRQLLAFARKQKITPKVLDLNETVGGILKMLRRLLGEQVKLVWAPGSALWNVQADPTQIDQVLANLSVNARDAMTGRNAVLEVSTENVVLDAAFVATHRGAREGEFVHLSVHDNGIGMDPRTLSRIFEPYFTTKAPGKGTGLGLSTVIGIVMQHDGFVDVESTPGIGSTFHLYFPRTSKVTDEKAAEERPLRRGTETILLAEDEEGVRTATAEMLRTIGYKVLLARDGKEAILLATSHADSIHLLLTDMAMPGMSGAELRDALLRQRPDCKVLFMSGYAGNVSAAEVLIGAGTHFVQKPFTMFALAEAVRSALDD